jgi:hypothetical protein
LTLLLTEFFCPVVGGYPLILRSATALQRLAFGDAALGGLALPRSRVHFLGGMSRRALRRVLRDWDVFVNVAAGGEIFGIACGVCAAAAGFADVAALAIAELSTTETFAACMS